MLYLCYSINNFAVMEAGISMLSFLENNPGYEPEEVFFIDYGIHPINKERLDGIAGRYGKRVTYLSGKPVTDEVRRQFPYLRPWQFTMAPNAKPFIDKIVPEYVDRLLFLDADTLVMRPTEELLHLDMKGAALAAVPQCWDTVSVRAGSLRLCHGGSMYFNSGVLLYDLDVWRKEDCHKMVMDTLQMKKQFYSPDQTLLNNAIPARLQYQLPLKYNHLTHYMHPRQEPKYLSVGQVHTKEEIDEVIHHTAIAHFTGGDHNARPWHKGCWSYHKAAYLHYKALSPWKDTPLLPPCSKLKKFKRRGFFGKCEHLEFWMMAKQPSLGLTRATMLTTYKLRRLAERWGMVAPGMVEGVERIRD